jgi:hypothetical protein
MVNILKNALATERYVKFSAKQQSTTYILFIFKLWVNIQKDTALFPEKTISTFYLK